MATSTTTSTTTAVTTKDIKSKLYLSMPRIPPKVYLKTVNPHITCNLCKGYLIDATTIVECLHSFCHSCIMMHLRRETYCPSCEMIINKVKPNIKPDATLQAIVYKLVPGLYEKELLRRRAFYKVRTKEALEATPEQRGDDTEHLIFGPNESMSLMLEYSDNDNAIHNSDEENSNSSHEINSSEHCDDDFEVQLRKPKYLQCPAIFTISDLKKFLLHKFSINQNKFCVEIMYKVKSLALPDYYTLMDVAYIFTWKRDAPMKFLYCVRAAHSPVANIEQSAVMYDLPPNRFSTNSQLVCASDSTDHEHDQSSDADSEARSDRGKEPETNGSAAQTPQEEPINSTSDEPSTPTSSMPLPTRTTSSATVTSTSLASTSTKTNSSVHASVNGGESQKKDTLVKGIMELASSPTTSSRLETATKIKSEPLSPSPEKPPSDRRSNGSSPKPNTSKSRNTTTGINVKSIVNNVHATDELPVFSEVKPSSPSRTNQDLKDSKEKVKTKSIMTGSSSKSGISTSNRSEQKTVTFSDRPSSSSRPIESKPMSSIERPKGRLLFNKEEKAKSLSPPLPLENVYDFDQHLIEESKTPKQKFLENIHLKPRIPSTDSPLVQLPKMPKTDLKSDTTLPTNLSKDKDNNKTSAAMAGTSSINRPSVSSVSSSSSSSSSSSGSVDKPLAKKPENKTSKRKSREPVKNVAKVKCASPNDRTIDTKWDPVKSTIISSVSPSSPVSTATASNPSSSSSSSSSSLNHNATDRLRRLQESPAVAERILAMSQQNKHNLKSLHASSLANKPNQSPLSTPSSSSSKSVFKTPTPSSSKESSSSQSTGLKQAQPSTSETTSIIINNVQRPNQADTPRPSMSFKSNVAQQPHPFFFPSNLNRSFPNETEIQEIRNDDLSKSIVYGPAMSLAKPFESPIPNMLAPMGPVGVEQLFNQFKQPPLNLQAFLKMQQLTNLSYLDEYNRTNNKPKKPAIDSKKSSSSSNYGGKTNSLQKNYNQSESEKQQNVQSLLTSCRIPASISISVMPNDESEAVNRSIFNSKNSNVVNSIEIVKLPDESSNEPNARFPSPSPSSSNADKSWQSNKNALNPSDLMIASCLQKTSFPDATFQAKFINSLETLKNSKKSKPPQQQQHQQKQSIRPNLNMRDELMRSHEAQKRKLHQLDDKSATKVRKLQPSVPQPKSISTSQRPIPDLLIPKEEKKPSNSISGQSSSSGINALANSRNDRQSPTVSNASDKSASLTLAVAQAKVQQVANEIPSSKYLPLQTSTMPIWANHCTADQMASHKALEVNLTQNKKNSGTFVD